jgi:serine/threonine protein kinase
MSRTTTKIVIARIDGTIMGQYVLGLGEHIIGREIDCAIYIDDPHVSRSHARLIITQDAVEIEDLGSTSGTYLDGVTVRGRIPVEPAQKVHISDLYIDIVREGFRELVAGARLTGGRFTLVKLLGQGGMGAVWLARDEVYEREVALKLLPAEMASDNSGLQDLEREVAKTATLDHANVLKIEGLVRTEDEPPFILMEYVAGTEALQGTDLDQVRRQTPNRLMPWSGVRHYMLQLCDALEYAHNKKIAHRDIKPSNLLINKQAQLKLADFGIAASIAGTASTMTVSVLDAGTPSYMSPQQIEGRQPQAADDIYSLGATFYDLLTSKPPFYQGDVVHQVLNMEATPIEQRLKELNLQNEVPDYVSSMVMACLQKDPSLRPPTAGAVKKWIESEGKADFVAVKQVQWQDAPLPTQVSAAPAATPASSPTLYAKASRVVSDWLPVAKRKKILAYGIVAAVLSILIGTATWWMVKPKEINGVSAAMQDQLKEGLVAYYPFNGNAKDESGNGHDGNVKGPTLTTDRHGKKDSAYSFDGAHTIDLPLKTEDAPDQNTLSGWIKVPNMDRHPTDGGDKIVFLIQLNLGIWWYPRGDKRDIYNMYHLYKKDGNGSGFRPRPDLPPGFDPSEWCHLAGTYDGETMKLYVNGVPAGELKLAEKVYPFVLTQAIGSGGGRPTFAQIDDVRIYNRALSEEEVAALYDLEKPDYSKNLDQGLVAYYPFNGNAKDESGNGNDGEVKGPALTTDRYSKANSAYSFDGADDLIRVAHNQSLNLLPMSISVWLRTNHDRANMGLVTKYVPASWDGYVVSTISVTEEGITYQGVSPWYTSGFENRIIGLYGEPSFNSTMIHDDIWHHFVFTVDEDGASIYLDGNAQQRDKWTGSSIKTENNYDVQIGAYGDQSYYQGKLDDIRIYNRALSAGEVKALYDSEKTSDK